MYLLLDIGGTHTRVAISNGKKIDRVIHFPTPANYKIAIKTLATAIHSLTDKKIKKVVVGLPRFSQDKLLYWHSNPLKKDFEKICKAPAILVNDAQLAGLGEAVYGNGKSGKIVAYLTFSTGLGGARIVNKNIDANQLGFEPTLQIVNFNSEKKTFISPTLFVSGRGIMSRYHKRPETIKDKRVWQEINDWIKIVVNNTATYWSPDLVVIGGAIAMNKNVNVSEIQSFIKRRFAQMPATPKIVKAKLGQHSGLMGALAIATKK